jgi:hypothetical protein
MHVRIIDEQHAPDPPALAAMRSIHKQNADRGILGLAGAAPPALITGVSTRWAIEATTR